MRDCHPVRQLLEKPEFRGRIVESAAERDARHAAFRKAHDAYPDNYFVLRSELRSFDDRGDALQWARNQRREHPDRPVYEMIEAEALLGRDTPEAIRRMEALKRAHPLAEGVEARQPLERSQRQYRRVRKPVATNVEINPISIRAAPFTFWNPAQPPQCFCLLS